jgi:hypothetical protein
MTIPLVPSLLSLAKRLTLAGAPLEASKKPEQQSATALACRMPQKGRLESPTSIGGYCKEESFFRCCFRFSLPVACVTIKHGYGYRNP